MATESKSAEYGPTGGTIAPNPAPERGVAEIISVSPDGANVVYVHGPNVIVRSVEDPSQVMVYSEHTTTVNVAKFSPSGKYVASGDDSGKVRVWAWTHPEHLLKKEVLALGGPVEDLAWGPESKRIAAVGGGSSKAKVFTFDTGSSLGEVIPASKKVITCDMKPTRPYRAVWGGEDFELQFYSGPPFRYTKGLKEHTNFVNCVRFSPDGELFLSVSSDKQAILYDAKTSDTVGRLNPEEMHSGSIYSCAWSPDSSRIVTSAADKTLRIWDVASRNLLKTITVGSAVSDMQNGVAWGKLGIVSLSLDGSLNMYDPDGGDSPTRVVTGHHDAIVALSFDKEAGNVFTICSGGRVVKWTPTNAAADAFTASVLPGDPHTKKGSAVVVAGGQVTSASWDNTLKFSNAETGEFIGKAAVGALPRGVAIAPATPTIRFVSTSSGIQVFDGETSIATESTSYTPTVIAVSPAGDAVAVGGEDKVVHFYKYAGGALTADGESAKPFGAAVSVLSFSPDGSQVAGGDTLKEVQVISVATKERVNPSKWTSHTTRVTGLAWRPSGSHLVSVSTDRRICLWDPSAATAVKNMALANPAPLVAVDWQSEDVFWACGTDGVVRRFEA